MKTRYLTRRVKHVKSENKKVYDLDILMVMNWSFKHIELLIFVEGCLISRKSVAINCNVYVWIKFNSLAAFWHKNNINIKENKRSLARAINHNSRDQKESTFIKSEAFGRNFLYILRSFCAYKHSSFLANSSSKMTG